MEGLVYFTKNKIENKKSKKKDKKKKTPSVHFKLKSHDMTDRFTTVVFQPI